jgi:hypothetical protein
MLGKVKEDCHSDNTFSQYFTSADLYKLTKWNQQLHTPIATLMDMSILSVFVGIEGTYGAEKNNPSILFLMCMQNFSVIY